MVHTQQQKLIEIIKAQANPDFVFVLASSTCQQKTESIFNPESATTFHDSGYVLLVLISNEKYKELQCWQDKLEHHCKSLAAVTTLVLLTSSFAEWITAGRSFALRVMQAANCIYDSSAISLPPPAIEIRLEDKEQLKHYETGLQRSENFLAGAELYYLRQQYEFAAFMLHQAAEQCLRTLLVTGTGYYCNIHSLDRLYRYCCLVSTHLNEVFSEHVEADKKLFQLLHKAYIDGRYGPGFKISAADIEELTVKVSRLQEILVMEAERFLQQKQSATPHEK